MWTSGARVVRGLHNARETQREGSEIAIELYMYMYTYIYIYIHICICIYVYIYLDIYIWVVRGLQEARDTRREASEIAIYIYVYIYIYIHTYVYVYMYIYICIYIYMGGARVARGARHTEGGVRDRCICTCIHIYT